MTEAIEAKEVLSTDEIVQKCLGWHGDFNQRFWRGKDSFHNAEHIRVTMIAAELLVRAALFRDDPLGIMSDLERWNKEHSNGQVKEGELPEVVKLVFACHDLGNIAEGAKMTDGKVELTFLAGYAAKGAEERSRVMATKAIESSQIPDEQKRRFLPLVRYLINETKFQPEGEVPFGVFIRVIDQIGNDLFSMNEKRVGGLLEEIYAENPQAEFNPYFFFNFARERFGQLVPDEAKRNSVLEIWNKKLPEGRTELARESTKVKDWLEEIKRKSILWE